MAYALLYRNILHLVVSVSSPCWLRTGGPRWAPSIPSAFLQPLLRAQCQVPVELVARIFAVNKVAKAAAHASLATIKPAARLAEVGDGTKLAVDGPGSVPATVKVVAGLLSRLLVLEARIDVADQVIVVVIADNELLELAVFAHLAPHVLVKGVKVVLQLRGVHAILGVEGRVLV